MDLLEVLLVARWHWVVGGDVAPGQGLGHGGLDLAAHRLAHAEDVVDPLARELVRAGVVLDDCLRTSFFAGVGRPPSRDIALCNFALVSATSSSFDLIGLF